MPRAVGEKDGRGGVRQGTPGKGYVNRTDLTQHYDNTKDAAGTAPMPAGGIPMQFTTGPIGADQIPNLSDPTHRPDEPVTEGLPVGAGRGPEALGTMPPPPADPVRLAVEAMLQIAPNPDLMRVLNRLDYEGR